MLQGTDGLIFKRASLQVGTISSGRWGEATEIQSHLKDCLHTRRHTTGFKGLLISALNRPIKDETKSPQITPDLNFTEQQF